jgi:hypothetical protein
MTDKEDSSKKSGPTYTTYDPEVEKRRIEYNEKLSGQIMDFLSKNIPDFMKYWGEGQKSEYHVATSIPKWIMILVGTMFLTVAVLTFYDKVPGESLTFLTGVIVGYLLSILKPLPEEE